MLKAGVSKHLAIRIIVLLCAVTLTAQSSDGRETIVIIPVRADDATGGRRADVNAIDRSLNTAFEELDSFNIIPIDKAARIFNLFTFSEAMFKEKEYVRRIFEGGITYVAYTTVSIRTEGYTLNLYVLNTKTGKVLSSKNIKTSRQGPDMVNKARNAVRKILKSKKAAKKVSSTEDTETVTGAETAVGNSASATLALSSEKNPTAEDKTDSAPEKAPRYKIGDTGPAGGYIFFIKPRLSGTWRYLEVSPVDLPDTFPWGAKVVTTYVPTAGKRTGLDDGKKNTEEINSAFTADIGNTRSGKIGAKKPKKPTSAEKAAGVKRAEEIGKITIAASACTAFNYNGFNDWYLPSKDELEVVYRMIVKTNFGEKPIGEWSGDSYWTSSQSSQDTAWSQRFADGRQYSDALKTRLLRVRPIRAFK